MGTGMQNTLLFYLPWADTHPTFRLVGAGFLILDICLFICFAVITVVRYTLYPEIFNMVLSHDTHSLFLGTIPMGFITIVTGIALLGHEYEISGGLIPVLVASGLWWIASVLACFTAFVVPYVMFTRHSHSMEHLTAAWLLPIVTPITIAASGATISKYLSLYDYNSYALRILLTSYILGGIGLLLSFIIMALYFQRLAVYHAPGQEVIVSTFLPLGPCGQGGYTFIELGRNSMTLFPLLAAEHPGNEAYTALSLVGPVMYGSTLAFGLMLWGLGIWWMFHAVVTVSTHYMTCDIAFNMSAWGVTFSLGSLALLTFSLGNSFDSLFFKVVGTGMTLVVFIMWWLVVIPTLRGFWRGTLFEAPYLSTVPENFRRSVFECRQTRPEHDIQKNSVFPDGSNALERGGDPLEEVTKRDS